MLDSNVCTHFFRSTLNIEHSSVKGSSFMPFMCFMVFMVRKSFSLVFLCVLSASAARVSFIFVCFVPFVVKQGLGNGEWGTVDSSNYIRFFELYQLLSYKQSISAFLCVLSASLRLIKSLSCISFMYFPDFLGTNPCTAQRCMTPRFTPSMFFSSWCNKRIADRGPRIVVYSNHFFILKKP